MTKAEIEALAGDVVDEYVAEQVLEWARAATVTLGGASVEGEGGAWIDRQGTGEITRRDGTKLAAPRYRLLPAATGTPDFASREHVVDVLAAMTVRGYQAMMERRDGRFFVSFVTPPASHTAETAIDSESGPDAVRRAALLAVQ